MYPNNMTDETNNQIRPTIFSEVYPIPTSTNRPNFDWNCIPGTSQNPSDYNFQNSGFNMQPQVMCNPPNFQFSNNQQPFGHTVQFPFPNIQQSRNPIRSKRKTDSPPLQPIKQFITEEKMSEHLSNLHISTETPASDMESEQVKEQRLYVCEEMKKFQSQTESIIPESILHSFNGPCTALVLWKPPSNIFTPLVFNRSNVEENENNNNESNRNIQRNQVVSSDMDIEDL